MVADKASLRILLTVLLSILVLSSFSWSNKTGDFSFTDIELPSVDAYNNKCYCKMPQEWTAQNGQDEYLFHRVFFPQALCCKGVFVEFGARNGIDESNTYMYERDMGWKGLMFEVDPREQVDLERNRPGAEILMGPVCPSTMDNVTIALSNLGGWTGAETSMGTCACFISAVCRANQRSY